jgi:hypothetical protein
MSAMEVFFSKSAAAAAAAMLTKHKLVNVSNSSVLQTPCPTSPAQQWAPAHTNSSSSSVSAIAQFINLRA